MLNMTDLNERLKAKARAQELKSKPLTTLKSVAELILAKAKEKEQPAPEVVKKPVKRRKKSFVSEEGKLVKLAPDSVPKHGGSRKGAGRPADPSVQLKYRVKKEMAMEVDAAIRELLSSKYGIVPKKIATKNSSD